MITRKSIEAAVAVALLAAGCATNPVTGARQFTLISEGQEIEMGREYDAQISEELGLVEDRALQAYVQEVGSRMASLSERPHLPWTFRVVDDPVVNAFALPGGYIFVTRGILAHLNSEAELAAVLGHEIGHVTARHSVSRMSTQQLVQIGLGVGTILRPELQPVAGVAGAGFGLLFLKYGREDERQADDLGLRYMFTAGYDPWEMPHVFETLEAVGQAAGGNRIPEWMSSHPNPGNRRERISGQVAQLPAGGAERLIERPAYLRRLDGMIFGENPREGYFRGAEFLHPDLAFRMTFPGSWNTSNQKRSVVAVSPNRDAIVQLTLAPQPSPDAAARQFFSKQGVRGGPARSTTFNGLPAAAGSFLAQTQDGVLQGYVAFVQHGGRVFQLIGYAPEARWPTHQSRVTASVQSFARLADRAALDVQPLRLRAVTLDQEMRLDAFAREYAPGVTVETVSLINNLPATALLVRGQVVKGVSGSLPR